MYGPAIFVLTVAGVAVLVALLPTEKRSEREARAALCSQLADQVEAGDNSLADYLSTSCPATLLLGEDRGG